MRNINESIKRVQKKLVEQVDPWLWAYRNKIMIQGVPWQLKGHEWQIGILQSTARKKVFRKGTQMGGTQLEIIRCVHGLIHKKYPKGIIYYFPSTDDVLEFSKARFAPLISDNPRTIGKYVKDTNATNVKRIGGAFIYFKGARFTKNIEGLKKEATKLRSTPCDKIVIDERDLIDDTALDMARQRMSHSAIREETIFSTPTVPDWGIDREYKNSDQRVWMIKCPHCGKRTCLELEFPACIRGGKRICVHCGGEINPADGEWVAKYPGRDYEGYWFSQLLSPYVAPQEIVDAFNNPPHGNIQEVYNSMLGLPYIAAENRLNFKDVLANCGNDLMFQDYRGPSAMGVDVGSVLHVVIGFPLNRIQHKIIYIGTVKDFTDLHDLAKIMGVRGAVIDLLPETHKVREFQEAEDYPIFLCQYKQSQRTTLWNNSGIVQINRTELLDRSHELLRSECNLELPRSNKTVREFARQCANMVKILEPNKVMGGNIYRYRNDGPDHYRHALGYYLLATEIMQKKNQISGAGFTNWNLRKRAIKKVMEYYVE